MEKAIEVRGLSKQYRLNARQERADTLRDVLAQQWRRWRGAGPKTSHGARSFWALDDVSFDVEAGEVLGVIGRNGAGKSTLLKILARITEPTRGEVDLHGRVGSLLEVGTGFHAELSGRENVYLNGAILGMRRREIQRRFDEIVDFAGVEQFIDTPVKHYSSGMYMRLAFAVAAHLETEILLVDEVLAVGDIQFQEKCLGKMSAVAQAGRTVLFVSHNLEAVGRMCVRASWLDRGKVVACGKPQVVIREYLQHLWDRGATEAVLPPGAPYTGLDVMINGKPVGGAVVVNAPAGVLQVSVTVRNKDPILCPRIDIAIYRADALKLLAVQSDSVIAQNVGERRLEWCLNFHLSNLALATQPLYFDLGIREVAHAEYVVLWPRVAEIWVENSDQAAAGPGSVIMPTLQVWVG